MEGRLPEILFDRVDQPFGVMGEACVVGMEALVFKHGRVVGDEVNAMNGAHVRMLFAFGGEEISVVLHGAVGA